MKFTGTVFNDALIGTGSADFFILAQGGDDTALGKGGNDIFKFGTHFDAADHIDGGDGRDTVVLNGDYSSSNAVIFDPATLVSVEDILLKGGHSYDLTTDDANLAAGSLLTVNAVGLAAGDKLDFDGSADTDGYFHFLAGQGIYDLKGSSNGIGLHDHFSFGANFNNADRIDGGLGVDHLKLGGDYTGSHALALDANAMANIEVIYLAGGYNYQIGEAADGAFGANTLPATFNAFRLNASDTFTFDGSVETSVVERIFCGEGTFHISLGSSPKNIIAFGGSFGPDDTVSANGANDTLGLNAAYFIKPQLDRDYTGGNALTIEPGQMKGIGTLGLTGGFSYQITMAAGALTDGDTLTIKADGYSFLAGGHDNSIFPGFGNTDKLTFDGSAVTGGHFAFDANAGLYHLFGGAQDDIFNFATKLTRVNDVINGGGGNDTVHLNGGADVVFNATTMTNVEALRLGSGHDYNIVTSNTTVARHENLTVDASGLHAGDKLTFNGSAETNGHFVIDSGGGRDDLTGGAVSDTFVYNDGITLSGATRDTIHAFNFSNDVVQFVPVTGIDTAVTTGSASGASIDSDLTALFGAGHGDELGAHHAVLFTASGGTLSGDTFLIIDGDGTAGYTAGADLVIQLANSIDAGSIGTANFS
ncbi:MAG TPA: bluetail domain-containing putative surface protein [Rhizomicrobium sp.]|jgi:hypothetical protein|nr:bluetail domain-containing putative surface protein [Rhizomicrobium sp.]